MAINEETLSNIRKNTAANIKAPQFNAIANSPVGVSASQDIKEKKGKLSTAWSWISKQIMKPVGAVAVEVENIGRFIGTGEAFVPGKDAFDVLSGKKEYSFGQMWSEYGTQMGMSRNVAGAIGFVVDIAADPLNFIGGGLTKTGKLARKVTSLKKAGKTIKATKRGAVKKFFLGDDLATAIKKSGLTEKQLILGASKLDQVEMGQRALLNIINRPVVGGTKAYKATAKFNEILKASKIAQAVKGVYSTKTGIKHLDELLDNVKNFTEYKKQLVIEKGIKIQKGLKGMDPGQIKLISYSIERPEMRLLIKDKAALKIADEIESLFKIMGATEVEKGLLRTQIEFYFPHLRAKETFSRRIATLFSPKKFSTDLPAAKGRTIAKFIGEDGKEIIGTAKKLKLKPLEVSKGLARDITIGEFNTIEQLENTLRRYGFDLIIKPQARVKGKYGGYITVTGKKVVIAGKRSFKDVVDTIKHEMTHGGQFQLAGEIEMMETISKRGNFNKARKLLEATKEVAKAERFKLYKAKGINFDELTPYFKRYYSEPTEILAHSASLYLKNPAKAKKVIPKTVKALQELKGGHPLFNLLDLEVDKKLSQLARGTFKDKAGNLFKKVVAPGVEIEAMFGKKFFELNPAIAYVQRGIASVKAVAAKDFLDEVGRKFFVNGNKAPLHYIESTNPLFKGMRAAPEVVRAVDQYMQGIKPDDLKLIVKGFDSMQNWWKAQALISPSYHTRNMVGNYWNNFLAGVWLPNRYTEAAQLQFGKGNNMKFTTKAGDVVSGAEMFKEAVKRRVIGKGQYASDIPRMIQDELGISISKLKKMAPWDRENALFKFNRRIGQAIENNARLAHFIDKKMEGFSYDDAARSVKKYLFDYDDLTQVERNLFKRVAPFYTWTRKNIPLQLESMIYQTEKYAAIPKVIQYIEAGVEEPKSERYLSSYIRDNIPVRIRTSEEGNTEYFLLGNWLPGAQAIDFLSQPIENMVNMVTPFVKTPMELWANQSMFFKNVFGEASKIEYYHKQPTEFMGITMRRKTAHLVRNLRVLNDINKWIDPRNTEDPENSYWVKTLNTLFGKAATFDVQASTYFARREIERRESDLKSAIRKAQEIGDKKRVEKLTEDLKAFRKEHFSR